MIYYTAIFQGYKIPPNSSTPRILLTNITKNGSPFRDHMWLFSKKSRSSHNKLTIGEQVVFMGEEVPYTKTNGKTQIGIRKVRNLLPKNKVGWK